MKLKEWPASFVVSCIRRTFFFFVLFSHTDLFVQEVPVNINWSLRMYGNLHRISLFYPEQNPFVIWLHILLDSKTSLRRFQIVCTLFEMHMISMHTSAAGTQ